MINCNLFFILTGIKSLRSLSFLVSSFSPFPFLSAKKGRKKQQEGKGEEKEGGKEGRNKQMKAEREGGKILKLRSNQISVS